MIWYLWALLGAVFSASYYTWTKKLLKEVNQYILAAGTFLSTFIILQLFALTRDVPQISGRFYFGVFGGVFVNVIAVTLVYKALKHTDLSLAMPIISFTPAFTLLTSFVLLGEFPTLFGLAGILLIVIGSYVLNISHDGEPFLKPIQHIFKTRGTVYMLIVAFLYSFGINFDKIVVINSDSVFGYSFIPLGLGLSFLVISLIQKLPLIETVRKHGLKIVGAGAILGLTAVSVNIALTQQIVPYVISIKRMSVLFGVLFGGFFFHEKNMSHRVLGALIMVSGMIVIIMF